MQKTNEIQSSLKNLHYYSQKISELAKQQLELDFQRGQELGMNSGPGSLRFDCLGLMQSSCKWIEVYCDNIEASLESAVKQDKVLHTEEEVEGIVG